MKERYLEPEMEIVELSGNVLTNSTEFIPDVQSLSETWITM